MHICTIHSEIAVLNFLLPDDFLLVLVPELTVTNCRFIAMEKFSLNFTGDQVIHVYMCTF